MLTGPIEFDPEQEYDFLQRLDEKFAVDDDDQPDTMTMEPKTDDNEKDTSHLQSKPEP